MLSLVSQGLQNNGNSWVVALIGGIALLAGGGGVVAWRRLGKEGPKIIVEAAQGAVIVQSGVIDDLQDGLDRARSEIKELRAQLSEADRLRSRVRELEHREEELTAENTALKAQVKNLQKRVDHLEEKEAQG